MVFSFPLGALRRPEVLLGCCCFGDCGSLFSVLSVWHGVGCGKPVLLARVENKWLLGLPGNPVSVVVGYHLHARRIMARLGGLEYLPHKARARLEADLSIKGSRFCVIGAHIEETEKGVMVFPSIRQQSGRLASIKGINGFIFVEGGTRTIGKGTEVNVEWMDQVR